MILTEFPASPATRHLVRVYRVVHFALDATQPRAVKVYPPTAEHCLQLFARESEGVEYPDGQSFQWNSVITGAHDVTVRRLVPADFLMVQVVLQPSAVHRLTGLHAGSLHNRYVDAEAVLGRSVTRVSEAIRDARTYREMVDLADGFVARLDARRRPPRDIDAALRLLRDEPLAAPAQATVLQALELAAAQVRRAGEVLARLRRQMQPGAAPAALAPVELGVLVRHLGVLWAPELARHAIAWRVEGQAPPALGDAVAAEQVLHNLLGNAVQALQLGPSTGRQITLRLSATLTHACCAVRDNGPGVPAAAQARLFAPFFSTRDGGLGLGLPLCQTLALAMNGAVRFQVPVGGGAEFVLELPLARTSPAPP